RGTLSCLCSPDDTCPHGAANVFRDELSENYPDWKSSEGEYRKHNGVDSGACHIGCEDAFHPIAVSTYVINDCIDSFRHTERYSSGKSDSHNVMTKRKRDRGTSGYEVQHHPWTKTIVNLITKGQCCPYHQKGDDRGCHWSEDCDGNVRRNNSGDVTPD